MYFLKYFMAVIEYPMSKQGPRNDFYQNKILGESGPTRFQGHCLYNVFTWRTTIKNRTPQAISTLNLVITIPTPPSWPKRLITTNMVARNQPHPQDISIYSLCSFHCVHIRMPSSKNVETRHALATSGRICLPFRATYEMNKR